MYYLLVVSQDPPRLGLAYVGPSAGRHGSSDFNSAASSGSVYRLRSNPVLSHVGHSTGDGPCAYDVCPGLEGAGRGFFPVPSHVVQVRKASMYQSCVTMAQRLRLRCATTLPDPAIERLRGEELVRVDRSRPHGPRENPGRLRDLVVRQAVEHEHDDAPQPLG